MEVASSPGGTRTPGIGRASRPRVASGRCLPSGLCSREAVLLVGKMLSLHQLWPQSKANKPQALSGPGRRGLAIAGSSCFTKGSVAEGVPSFPSQGRLPPTRMAGSGPQGPAPSQAWVSPPQA